MRHTPTLRQDTEAASPAGSARGGELLALLQGMGVVEFIVIPVITLIAIIVASVWSDFSPGAVAIGAIVIALLLGGVSMLLRYTWNVEEGEGVHEETGESTH